MENKPARLHGIDALRGFTVLSMVAYHFLYDVNILDITPFSKLSIIFVSCHLDQLECS